MSNTIRIKRGKSNNLSVSNLQDGELALTLDTNKLYTNKGQISPDNVYVGDTEPTDSNIKCWISPSGKIDLSSLWDQIYPVGSIYLSVNATNPSVLFGGTWEQLKGKFLVGVDSSDTDFNTSEKTGGEKTHVLTSNEMPSHTHTQASCTDPGNHKHTISTWYNGQSASAQTVEGWGTKKHEKYHYTGDAGSHTHTITLNNTGGGQAHNNMPPYMTVYMWKRIS